MSLSDQQMTLRNMFMMLDMTDIGCFTTSSGVKYVSGILRGKNYLFSHKLHKDGEVIGYILSVDGDIRIETFDPKLIADAIKLLLRNNDVVIPKTIFDRPDK